MTRRARRPQTGRPKPAAFSVMELLVVITMVLLLASLSINAALNQWRDEQAYAVAEELAGWLVLVQRAAMRGSRCTVTIPETSASLSRGQTLAEASQGSGSSLTNSCTAFSPLQISTVPANARFTISPAPLSFSFTPRGTIAGTSSDPVVITISNQAGGTPRCVRLDGLLGVTQLGSIEAGSCRL